MDRKEHKQWGREEMVMKMREMGMLDQFNAVVDLMEAEVYGMCPVSRFMSRNKF